MSFRSYINRRYANSRAMSATIDPRVSTPELVAFLWRKTIDRLRAGLRGYPGKFVGGHVRFRGRRHIRLGRGVVVGRNVLLDGISAEGLVLGDRVTIDENATIRCSGTLRNVGVGVTLGERVAIGANCFIHGGGGVMIGKDSLLGPYVRVFSENHIVESLEMPVIEQGEFPGRVRVGRDVWIGSGATILAGVTIGDQAIVAAGAVVTGDVGEREIVAGVPARVTGRRGELRPPA